MKIALYSLHHGIAFVSVVVALLGCKSGEGEAEEPDKPFKQCFPVTLQGEMLCDPAKVKFSLGSKNRHYPLLPGSLVVLEGTDEGKLIRVERRVLDETQVIAGVTTHVLEAKEFKDNKLYEVARNFYVEADDGTVCYFGEDVAFYENDKVINNDGSWRAGVDGARPGIIMPAKPTTDQAYFQENAPGIAQDMGRVSGTNGTVTLAGMTHNEVVTISDGNPLDACDKLEAKVYFPGIGEAGDTVKKLVSFTPSPIGSK